MSKELGILIEKSNSDNLTLQELEKLFNLLRVHLINHNTYKWSVKKYKNFVLENNFSYCRCYKALKESSKACNKIKNKGINEFISKIEKFNSHDNLYKYRIKEGSKKVFLQGLQSLRLNYFPTMNDSEFLNFIDSNFDTGFKTGSLRNYYYKNINNKKTS